MLLLRAASWRVSRVDAPGRGGLGIPGAPYLLEPLVVSWDVFLKVQESSPALFWPPWVLHTSTDCRIRVNMGVCGCAVLGASLSPKPYINLRLLGLSPPDLWRAAGRPVSVQPTHMYCDTVCRQQVSFSTLFQSRNPPGLQTALTCLNCLLWASSLELTS